MIDFDGKELQEEFNRVFASKEFLQNLIADILNELQHGYGVKELESYGKPTCEEIADKIKSRFEINNLSVQKLWWMTRFAKHVRGRCRNNSAFNNYMNRNFAPAKFSTVQKEYQKQIDNVNFETVKYLGLKIEVAGQSIEDKDE